MNKLMLMLLLFPWVAFADAQPDAAQEFTRAAAAIAAPDWVRVSYRKTAAGADNVGLLAPSRLLFTATGDLTEKGRALLEKAEAFARQTGRKLNVLIPQDATSEGMSAGNIQRNALLGNHVYISTKD